MPTRSLSRVQAWTGPPWVCLFPSHIVPGSSSRDLDVRDCFPDEAHAPILAPSDDTRGGAGKLRGAATGAGATWAGKKAVCKFLGVSRHGRDCHISEPLYSTV